MDTTQKTKLLGIIGTPVEHTLSPQLHSYLAREAGCDTAYLAFDVQPEDLGDVVRAAGRMGALGFNITSPHKIAVMEHLDVLDPEAERMGTVNTIVNRNGRWHGFNTDGDGFVNALEFDGIALAGKHILILGAGGSARSIAYKFACKNVGSITVSGRTPSKTEVILDVLRTHTPVAVAGDMDARTSYDIIVNTTPLGMHPHEGETPFERFDLLAPGGVVCDIIYNPAKTRFLLDAEARGIPIVNGLNMLALQGVYAYELYSGLALDEKRLYHGLLDLFSDFRIGQSGNS